MTVMFSPSDLALDSKQYVLAIRSSLTHIDNKRLNTVYINSIKALF